MRSLVLIFALLLPASSSARLIYHGDERVRAIALTFDAGADRGRAASILQTLEWFHVRASFGMTGRWAEASPFLVRRMVRDGDVLIDHTYDHRSFTGVSSQAAPLTTAQRTWEILHADVVVRKITGKSMKPYFRPPYGDLDPATLTLAGRLGYARVVMWTVDSLGWRGLAPSAILQRCLELATPGGIIIMHVGIQSQDAYALAPLIQALKLRHYRLVTVPQLIAGH